MEAESRRLRLKINELFGIYPKMSPTMLQAALGPSLTPRVWRPVLDAMLEDGTLRMDAVLPPTASGRSRAYTVLSLTSDYISSIKVPPAPPTTHRLIAAE